ncbi:MAG: tRNA (adenosine(37)-N6)-threonylcarbamoyltransferase complex dimerization subunit type 1 TsaB [Methylocystaceae bacterium]|jgi:tRNA threonylcarbamoyladenosine biosynthesis protein TsaB|nr:tRNA (adenosine(37)-N6)-threonylcarbamoyltransferase complex dimerization subunit type 1 TsaB [Methylocystaceae bacterium]NBT96298.1 tRNA (adenosine(37)-N6)-threonylcarbamoyltransferase complex dimerization subunit type 1 TsaB [Methylocystaceae bacterium]
MRILAIDTALPAVSACVLDDEALQPIAHETLPMARGHAEAVMPLIQRVVARAPGGFPSIDRVAVTVGPGSFTGIRIGLAAAQGVALACKCDLVGVSTLSALASPLILEESDGVIAAAIDARHDHVFIAAFAADGHPILSPRRVGAHEALRALGSGPLRLVGSGAEALAREARTRGIAVKIIDAAIAPNINFVARLGLVADPALAPARPLYLKEPDVTLARGMTMGGEKLPAAPLPG